MNIYTKDGWLDIPHINEVADRNGINFIFIIGKRQVGKTYGVLKFMLDSNKSFMFSRRTATELDMLEHNVNSPFEAIAPNMTRFRKEGKYTAQMEMLETSEEGDNWKSFGLASALSTIGNIRGFNGKPYTDWVIDEAIPEVQLFKIRNEKDTFLNAHVTINGNRELEGKPCLRTWLLANSNSLESGILEALNITRVVEKMSLAGVEDRILKDRGIMILMPESKAVIEKRKKTGLMRAISHDSQFARMAFENEFAYNDYSDVRSLPIQNYLPLVSIGEMVINLHKNDKTLYITDTLRARARHIYQDNEAGRRKFNVEFSDVRSAYIQGRVIFNNQKIKNYFKNLVNV